ncbi:hypothetical protein HDU97_000961 [Phlyctochytrium planicorne]|nr:hypothetical protein HDU97_000961 [Phlyctochytrium planicorne]
MVLRSSPLDAASLDARDVWIKRLEFMCSGHRKHAQALDTDVLRDVARIFADFFKDANTVVSDVMVGLIYVRRKQRLERKQRNARVLAESLVDVSGSTTPVPASVDGIGITRVSPVFEEPDGIPMSPPTRRSLQRKEEKSIGSPVSFGDIDEVTYFFQYAEAIYVIVDLNCDLASIQVPWSGTTISAKTHSGMLMTAGNIRDEIAGLLEELLLKEDSQYRDFRLIVCGHSLGAGVASLLSYLLKLKGHNVTCYAYSPPGCISTAETIPFFSSFCTSVILGDDIVPRLNRRTIERLKIQVKAAVQSCRRRKVEVLGGFVLADLFGIKAAALDSRDDGWWNEVEETIHADPATDLEQNLAAQGVDSPLRQSVDVRGEVSAEHVVMHVPGRVLYFVKERISTDQASEGASGYESPDDEGGFNDTLMRTPSSSTPSRRNTRTTRRKRRTMYRATWASPMDINDIVISGTMGADHLPNSLGFVLNQAWESGKSTGTPSPVTYWV